MSVKPEDIITINASTKSINKSIEYALLSWTAHYNRMGKASPYARMEKIIVGKVAEESVFKIFDRERIKYDTKGKTKWYQIDQYDVAINEHPVDIKCNFIDLNNSYFLKRIPGNDDDIRTWICTFHSLVPMDQMNATKRSLKTKTKKYIFAYLEGQFTPDKNSVLVHAFWDYKWLKKGEEKNSDRIGKLKLSYPSKNKSFLTIYGTSEKNKAIIERIELGKSVTTKNDFFQIFSIKFEDGFPDSVLTVKSENLNLTEKIFPDTKFNITKEDKVIINVENNWSQIWLNNCRVHVAGYIDEDDFKIVAEVLPRYSKNVEQYQDTLADNFGCMVHELNTLMELKNI